MDYIHIYTKYLIPFFGAYQINDITQEVVDDYAAWRISQMGKEPKSYTQRRHAGLYKQVIERARAQGLIHQHRTIPLLEIAGDKPRNETPEVKSTAPIAQHINRFYGTVKLDPERTGRDASRVADEVVSHLVALMGSDVIVTLEISASLPNGVPDSVIRTVTENSKTLKFINQGFDSE